MDKTNHISIKVLIMAVLMIALPSSAAFSSGKMPKSYKIKVLETLPFNSDLYTQGLFFHSGNLYVSGGQYGSSSFHRTELKSAKSLKSFKVPKEYFLEGAAVVGSNVYILTWQERVCFVHDINSFKQIKTIFNPKEGWGLTYDGTNLIMSDGSSDLFFLDPATFKEKSKISVNINGRKVSQLNELEYINGEIWANVYMTDQIVIINPKSGNVTGIVDCKGLLAAGLRTDKTDVLNGIAYNTANKGIYITGKYWPKIYRIALVM